MLQRWNPFPLLGTAPLWLLVKHFSVHHKDKWPFLTFPRCSLSSLLNKPQAKSSVWNQPGSSDLGSKRPFFLWGISHFLRKAPAICSGAAGGSCPPCQPSSSLEGAQPLGAAGGCFSCCAGPGREAASHCFPQGSNWDSSLMTSAPVAVPGTR